MKDYTGIGIFGFILSSTLGWGDLFNAFVLGITGAVGAIIVKAIHKWAVKKLKSKGFLK